MRRLAIGILLFALASTGSSLAVQPDEILKDPALEARARTLSSELRCLVCQNQSIDDSEAPLARDLRLLVRERLTEGDSDKQVLDFLVSRYGQFVLLRPRLEFETIFLWGLPPAALIAGAIGLFATLRRRNKLTVEAAPLSREEQQRLSALVHRDQR
jgi:cytochrome c-type biogenesis protein CcmH